MHTLQRLASCLCLMNGRVDGLETSLSSRLSSR